MARFTMTTAAQFLTLLLLSLISVSLAVLNHDISYKSYSSPVPGVPVAFADFDANSYVDIFVLDSTGKQVGVYLINKNSVPKYKSLVSTADKILGVIAADFNGDSRVDLALSVQKTGSIDVLIAFGLNNRTQLSEPKLVISNIQDQPTLMDFNADMLADLLVTAADNSIAVYTGQFESHSLSAVTFNNAKGIIPRIPNSIIFSDLDNNMRADLLIPVKSPTAAVFAEIMRRTNGGFVKSDSLTMPSVPANSVFGQLSVCDLDNDSIVDIILPVCSDSACTESLLFIYFTGNNAWFNIPVDHFKDKLYSWIPMDASPLKSVSQYPIQVQTGDIDLNGYIDFLVTLKSKTGYVVAVLTFTDNSLKALKVQTLGSAVCPKDFDVGVAAFGDLDYDGALDLILGCKHKTKDDVVTSLFNQDWNEDGYFFKVIVLNGKCGTAKSCPDNVLPFGLPVPGACVKFSTESPTGGYRYGIGCQAYQQSYNSLKLPMLHFGLGPFSNYIDSLSVAIPYNYSDEKLSKDFPFLIPNSQLVVIPYPNKNPALWTSELFVLPFYDKQILYVGITLLVTCFLVSIIAIIFQAVEYRTDKLERIRGQQGVVFDPMVGR